MYVVIQYVTVYLYCNVSLWTQMKFDEGRGKNLVLYFSGNSDCLLNNRGDWTGL